MQLPAKLCVFIVLSALWVSPSSANMQNWVQFQQINYQDPYNPLQYQREMSRFDGVQSGSIVGQQVRVSQMPPLTFKDFVTLENPPKKVQPNYHLKVKFQCSKPFTIVLFMDGNQDILSDSKVNETLPALKDPDTIFFRKVWGCQRSPREFRISFHLKFPPQLRHPPHVLMQKAWSMEDAKLKVAMIDQKLWDFINGTEYPVRDIYHVAFEKSSQRLQLPLNVQPPYSRSEKSLGKCYSWPYEMYNDMFKNFPPKSVPDGVVTEFVKYPIALPPDQFGPIRSFMRCLNPEFHGPQTAKDPRFTVSMVMFLMSPCKTMCGLFQHIDDEYQYSTPAIFINNQGQIHLQAQVANNNSYAFVSDWSVPIREWFRVDIRQTGVLIKVTMLYGGNFSQSRSLERQFNLPLDMDFLNGYFVSAGSVYSRCQNGLIGSATMWRNVIVKSNQIPIPDSENEMFSTGIEDYFSESDHLKELMKWRWAYLVYSTKNETNRASKGVCTPYFLEIIQPNRKEPFSDMCPVDSKPLPRRYQPIDSLLRKLARKPNRPLEAVMDKLSVVLYNRALKLLESPKSILKMRTVINVLEKSALLGYGQANFLLYVIHANGFGTNINVTTARMHLFAGAIRGERMCVKSLAYKHSTGEDGFSKDDDNTFYYYFNAAQTAQIDRQVHLETMTEVNRVRLTDEVQLKQQTAEDEDLFQWFKHQASTGVFHAKRNLGQLLYWGKQGLKRNLKAAFEYYEQAAQNTEDPSALYDYGITLMKVMCVNVTSELQNIGKVVSTADLR